TYPDGSQDKVSVTVKVVENPSQADSNQPSPVDQTVKVGDPVDPSKSITNLGDLPVGTKVEFESPVDTSTAGDKPATALVTYPDGSQDKVSVTVKVVENPSQADSNQPSPVDQTVNVGGPVDPSKSITNLGDLPVGTKVEFESPVDTSTAGDKPATVLVTYPDGSQDKVSVTVKVVENPASESVSESVSELVSESMSESVSESVSEVIRESLTQSQLKSMTQKVAADRLPNTGDESSDALAWAGLGVLGLGLLSRKKRTTEEDLVD
ncbi:Rib/alpha-like domain-containing protein, partial [Streptococcus danieliae]|uniref:Rib/alpha-like domain-containing protein n=1 Tax=Streptococcus danieliae TaxID=747656 RepID=UPI0023EE7A4D